MSTETKVVTRYVPCCTPFGDAMHENPEGGYVTHADYRALEERHSADVQGLTYACDTLKGENDELREELASLRAQHEMVRQCCMDETVRATRLMGDLEELRKKSDSLVVASTAARRELQSCQAVIHLHGGFDPAYVEGAQKAMRDLSAVLERFA